MFSRQLKPIAIAFHEMFADSGFSMAGAVASFTPSLRALRVGADMR